MVEFSQTEGQEEHDVDAIIAQAYGHSNPSPESKSQEAPKPSEAPPEPQYKEYEFNARGQAVKIRENDPRFQQWLSQGYDYSQNVSSFKNERQAWDQQKSEFEKSISPYKEIDSFARQNPEWWAFVDQSYKERLSNQQSVPDSVKQYLDKALGPIVEEIPLVKQYLQKQQALEIEQQQKDQDTKLDQAMKSIQEKYPDLDFRAKDESGFSLEHRVLNHAVQNGFPTFRAAFLDYYHDNLEKIAEARGRESISKQMAERKKMGLLDENSAPTSKSTSLPFGNSAKPRSWNDLRSEDILREFKFS